MKKLINMVFVFVLVFGLVLVRAPQTVQAKPEEVEEAAWNTGTEVVVDLVKAPAPNWLQLFGKGVKLTGPAKICHAFRHGQFGWTGEIRQLVDGKWVKLTTVNAWVPSEEGVFTSCAQAPSAGTYALFGSYKTPENVQIQECVDILIIYPEIEFGPFNTLYFNTGFIFPPVPVGSAVSFEIFNIFPVGALTGDLTGHGYVDSIGPAFGEVGLPDVANILFDDTIWLAYGENSSELSFTVRFYTTGCYKDFEYPEFMGPAIN